MILSSAEICLIIICGGIVAMAIAALVVSIMTRDKVFADAKAARRKAVLDEINAEEYEEVDFSKIDERLVKFANIFKKVGKKDFKTLLSKSDNYYYVYFDDGEFHRWINLSFASSIYPPSQEIDK